VTIVSGDILALSNYRGDVMLTQFHAIAATVDFDLKVSGGTFSLYVELNDINRYSLRDNWQRPLAWMTRGQTVDYLRAMREAYGARVVVARRHGEG
jgi:hypothetical protein